MHRLKPEVLVAVVFIGVGIWLSAGLADACFTIGFAILALTIATSG